MANAAKLNSRYEQLEILGEGGMGMVYRAYDSFLRREVTLKTVRDIQDQTVLELFKKEVNVLSGISHPNIVEIFDVGELNEAGGKRPYFVMPLLRGVTLDKLIKSSSQRLTISRCVDIMSQVCRGLQAAHDAGLVHRDLKPSNLFILEDDSVKIIDFGVAHLVDAHSTAGMKGTLLYMAPEQILLKRPSPLSDVFAAAVVCFVAMTRRHPFEGVSREEIADAIVNRIPAPASDFNPAISPSISQVIHKAMAKQPFQRFASARDFSENLQKALRNEPIDCFNPDKIEARITRAKKAFEEGQLGIASDILSELEAEASLHRDIAPLRKRIDEAHKEKTVAQLLDTARRCFEGQEYQLALQKVQEVLNLDNTNTEARSLQGEIENKRSSDQIEDWCRIALQHLENHSYSHARDALQNVLKLKPKEAKAQQLMLEVDRREQEYIRVRQQKEQFYQAALNAMQMGELSAALTKLERVLEMDRRAPDTFAPDRAAMYQKLYNDVRSQHDLLDRGYAEARRHIETGNYHAALALCAEFLEKYPEHAMFRSLRLDAEDRQRQEVSAYVARVSREVEAEPDLSRRIAMLEEALGRYPDEPHFSRALENNRTKRELVESIVAKARAYENGGQYPEALDQWRIVRDIYLQYPGLDFEADRVQKRKEQKERSDAQSRWVEQIDDRLNLGDFARAVDLCGTALAEFPNDSELLTLERASQQGLQRMADSQRLLDEARAELAAGDRSKGIELLRQSLAMQPSNAQVRTALLDTLIADARDKLDHDWRAAEGPVQEVTELDPGNARAKSLRTLIQDKKQEEYISDVLSRAREMKDSGNSDGAIAVLDEALGNYPKNPQLLQRRSGIENGIKAAYQQQVHKQDLNRAQELLGKAEQESDLFTLRSIFDETQVLAKRYPGDPNFETLIYDIKTKLTARESNAADRIAESAPAPSQPASRPPFALRDFSQIVRRKLAVVYAVARPWAKNQAAATAGRARASWGWLRQSSRSLRHNRSYVQLGTALAGVVAVVLILVAMYSVVRDRTNRPPERSRVSSGRLDLKLEPADAQFEIYNKDRSVVTQPREQLQFGEYIIRVSAPGFQPEEQHINFQGGAPILVTLRPLSQAFELFSDIEGLAVTLDGQPLTPTSSGQYTANDLSPEQHTIVMGTPTGLKANVTFVSKQGTLPEVVSFTSDRVLRAVAISSYGGIAQALKPAGVREKVAVAWNGETPEEIDDAAIPRTGLALQEHSISFIYGSERRDQTIKINAGPKLAVFISDQNLGTLIIDVGHQDVLVEINDKQRQARKAQGNRLAMGLEPKEYAVRIRKDGFYPEEQKVTIRKGETQTLKVALRAVANFGTLVVRRGNGTQVSVGGQSWQPITGDGETTLQTPLGGPHSIRVRKAGHRIWEETRQFAPDRSEVLDIGDIKFQALEAVITFKLSPSETRVRVTGSDGQEIPFTGRSITLPEGKFQALGTASAEYDVANKPFEVVAGRNQEIEITLKRKVEAPKPAPVAVSPMDGWKPEDWRLADGGWYERTGDGRALYTRKPLGSVSFGVLTKGGLFGGNKFRVLVGYRGPQDFIQFEVHRDKVVLTKRKGANKIFEKVNPHKVNVGNSLRVRIAAASDTVILYIANGANWVQVHSHTSEDGDVADGQFGLDGVKGITDFRREQ